MIDERQWNGGGGKISARINADPNLTRLDLLDVPGCGKAEGCDRITGSYKNICHNRQDKQKDELRMFSPLAKMMP